jgi:hypothetical protein
MCYPCQRKNVASDLSSIQEFDKESGTFRFSIVLCSDCLDLGKHIYYEYRRQCGGNNYQFYKEKRKNEETREMPHEEKRAMPIDQ